MSSFESKNVDRSLEGSITKPERRFGPEEPGERGDSVDSSALTAPDCFSCESLSASVAALSASL